MKNVALITGASRGIGYATAKYFASKGYHLILLARNQQKLVATANQLNDIYKIDTKVIATDICDYVSVAQQAQAAINQFGRLDVLINAAGIFLPGSSQAKLDDFSAMLNVNVMAIHHLCKLCSPFLAESNQGRIFNIASVSGIKPYGSIAAYVASKHALVGYSLSIGRELLKQGIKVTTICPDVVNTDMSQSSGLKADEKIATTDITKAIEFVMSLSNAAVIEQLIIGRNAYS